MTLTISDSSMTSDQTVHTARQALGRQHGWQVSWLPGQLVDRSSVWGSRTRPPVLTWAFRRPADIG